MNELGYDKDYSEPDEPVVLTDSDTGEKYVINLGGYRIPVEGEE